MPAPTPIPTIGQAFKSQAGDMFLLLNCLSLGMGEGISYSCYETATYVSSPRYRALLVKKSITHGEGNGMGLNERGQSLVDATYLSLGYSSNSSGTWIKA